MGVLAVERGVVKAKKQLKTRETGKGGATLEASLSQYVIRSAFCQPSSHREERTDRERLYLGNTIRLADIFVSIVPVLKARSILVVGHCLLLFGFVPTGVCMLDL